MEINITHMVNDADEMPMLSGSAFELGDNAGTLTWNNSQDYAKAHPLLSTPEQIQEAREYFREFGAWSKEEIEAWSEAEVQALIVQDIASSIREMEAYDTWEHYQDASEKGQAAGRIDKDDDNQFYFYMGS